MTTTANVRKNTGFESRYKISTKMDIWRCNLPPQALLLCFDCIRIKENVKGGARWSRALCPQISEFSKFDQLRYVLHPHAGQFCQN